MIPCTVTDIGDGDFSGHRRLNSVTVQDENNGGSGHSRLTTAGQAAFGKDTDTAYSETRTIQDAVNPNITYTGLVGADFYLPAGKEDLFINGETCYTGNITPLPYVQTIEPTCTEAGYDAALSIMELYRRNGMQAFFYGIAEEADLVSLGEINKMTHVLHFVDEESIRLVSIADEMGGFTVDISINDLILPK